MWKIIQSVFYRQSRENSKIKKTTTKNVTLFFSSVPPLNTVYSLSWYKQFHFIVLYKHCNTLTDEQSFFIYLEKQLILNSIGEYLNWQRFKVNYTHIYMEEVNTPYTLTLSQCFMCNKSTRKKSHCLHLFFLHLPFSVTI